MSRGLTAIFSSLETSFFKAGNVRKRGGRADLLIGGKEPPTELPRL